MNARHFLTQSKALAATALLALTGAANAGGGVYWSVGVDAPIQYPGRVQAVVSNGPRYYAPQPVVYVQPTPVYVAQPRYYYAPQPVVYEAPRAPRCLPRVALLERWHHHHHHAEDYASGYGRGDDRGYDRGQGDDRDDRRGGWGRRD
jgi:hypothetical protein